MLTRLIIVVNSQYINIESLGCTSEINSMLFINYISIKNKLSMTNLLLTSISLEPNSFRFMVRFTYNIVSITGLFY